MKTDAHTMAELDRLLQEYVKEVNQARQNGYLQQTTARTYLLHSTNFVNWCKGEFVPGGRNK